MKRNTHEVQTIQPGYRTDQSVTPPHGDPERAYLVVGRTGVIRKAAARHWRAGALAVGALAVATLAVGAWRFGSRPSAGSR